MAGVTVGSRNTRYRAARYGLTRAGLSPAGLHQLSLAPSEIEASSFGGRGSVVDLGDRIQRMRYVKPGAVPIIELGAAPMQTKYGKKSKPVFKVVDWRYPDGSELPDPPRPKPITQVQPNGDLQDEIPF